MPAAARRSRTLFTRAAAAAAAVACLAAGGVAHGTGIDVSRWQHNPSVSWAKVKADGVTFAFIKATEGAYYTNSYFAGDWAATKRVGIYRGAYHFARPSAGSAARQARYFVAQAGRFGARGDLPPVLDLEDDGGLDVTALRRWTRVWLRTTERLTGRRPIIYTGPYFWESELGNTRAFRGYPLWVAHYGTASPRVPGGWSDWTFWQRTDSGRIDGINGAVDVNRFNGTRAALARLAQDRSAGGTGGTGGGGGEEPGTGTTPDAGSDPGTGTTPQPGTDLPDEPAPAPTTVSLRLSRDSVYAGASVEVSGSLRTTTGEPLPDRHVRLYQRTAGTVTWTRIASPLTDGSGRWAASLAATGPMRLRAEYLGTRSYAASTSRRHDLTVRQPARTTATLAVDESSRAAGSVKVYGHLRTAAGRAVVGKTMHLYERPNGSTRWTLVARARTLSPTGWYQLYVTPSRSAEYQAVFEGSRAHAPTRSAPTRVRP